jgi:hypothetical protein
LVRAGNWISYRLTVDNSCIGFSGPVGICLIAGVADAVKTKYKSKSGRSIATVSGFGTAIGIKIASIYLGTSIVDAGKVRIQFWQIASRRWRRRTIYRAGRICLYAIG